VPEKGRQLRAIQRHAVASISRAEELNAINHRRGDPGGRIKRGIRSFVFELHGGVKSRRPMFRQANNTEQSRTDREC
jgi:hypothetical protein